MTDFIEEVDERVRSDRYRDLARRYAPWFAAALIAVIVGWVGAWGYQTWQNRNIGKASMAYDKALTSLAQGDQTGAFTGFDAIGKAGPAGYRTLSLMQQGNIRLMAGKNAEAAAFYDAAAKAAPNTILRDLAGLRAAQSLLDSAGLTQSRSRLAPLIGDKKPFDLEAREALAMAKLMAGDTRAARDDFNALTLTLGVSESMRQRAQAAITIIDAGEGAMIGQAVKAAALLPPGPPPGLGPAAAGGPDQGAQQEGQGPQGPPGSGPAQPSGGNAE